MSVSNFIPLREAGHYIQDTKYMGSVYPLLLEQSMQEADEGGKYQSKLHSAGLMCKIVALDID